MKYHLSSNSKGLHTFDKTRKSCYDSCEINKICYMNNNMQLKINKVYKDKLDSNDKLIKSSKFVRIITREIKFKNGGISKVRIFSHKVSCDCDVLYNRVGWIYESYGNH